METAGGQSQEPDGKDESNTLGVYRDAIQLT